ncbi:sugar phosphate isomerase/epimerase family protein [Prosthecobacter dejongeii]|uniref:Sugar phosphate isomerase/epimerase n=1 Tax=Prosthecobacter dejongeii TaxID=48465 RepID=A0A7W7YJC5_9BACT|nr:TIM barrel protein [Prosthecobacter dejongeii]MBB5037258.1 sugar phosphate isomerase/epimerase [Prosthecobacter dejongeii]
MTRRGLLTGMFAAALPLHAVLSERRLGLAIASYSHRWRGSYSSFKVPPFKHALDVMDHIRGLGFCSLQIGVEGWTLDFAKQVRQTCESYDMTLEGCVKLPAHAADVTRFERELRTAREAGVRILRSALGGRRYEVFTRRADFEGWKANALKSMALAEPIARRLQMQIGIENHKDWEVAELVAALKGMASEHMGACVDTGNSLALLEDPMAVVEALAPYAVTVHLKDLAVKPYQEGFQMSEVPLGQGSLDLAAMLDVLIAARPSLKMHLEMITRDPLDIPCLRDSYWITFPDKPGLDLVRTLAWVKANAAAKLPLTIGQSMLETLTLEEENIRRSVTHYAQMKS